MSESSARTILELSNDELAWVTGGVTVINEDGKEQYPACICNLIKTKGKGKGKRRR